MTKVGVIGLGMMGGTHLDVYAKLKGAKVVAVSDANPQRLAGTQRAAGNVKGQAQGGFDLSNPKLLKYDEGMDLIADPDIELVDICLPTPMHVDYAVAALKAGKHVLLEKPAARTSKEAAMLVEAARKAKGLCMIAMCMRFWPGWDWLKTAVEKQTYGKVLAAHFRRVANHPGGPFYSNGEACGGAALDLHIHDTDFVQYLFGMPRSVSSVGYSRITSEIDHLVTTYEYDHVPMVVAEGGWAMSPGFGFSMRYTVNFEDATAIFDIGAPAPLLLARKGACKPVKLAPKMGYELEIKYFLDCIAKQRKPSVVTLQDAANSVKIVEAEVKSARTGKTVKL